MQAPHKARTVSPTHEQIVFCPKCNLNLFSPVYTYAITSGEIIDAPPILSQSLEACKCGGCGTIIPIAQMPEFTLANLKKYAEEQKAKEAMNDAANAEGKEVTEEQSEHARQLANRHAAERDIEEENRIDAERAARADEEHARIAVLAANAAVAAT